MSPILDFVIVYTDARKISVTEYPDQNFIL